VEKIQQEVLEAKTLSILFILLLPSLPFVSFKISFPKIKYNNKGLL
jgi:hypothetical protein